MSDWWYSNPGNSGWFKTFTPHWRQPTNGPYQRTHHLPPGGWHGSYRPHWQHPQFPVLPSHLPRLPSRPVQYRWRVAAAVTVLIPYLWHIDDMLPTLRRWVGL